MKICPICEKSYPDSVDFCFNDGAPLEASDEPDPASSSADSPSGKPAFDRSAQDDLVTQSIVTESLDLPGDPFATEDPSGLPDDPAGLPDDPAGLPDDPSGLLDDPAGLPEDPAGLPEDPAGLPDDPSGLPEDPAGLPEDSAGLPGDADQAPQDSAAALPEGGDQPEEEITGKFQRPSLDDVEPSVDAPLDAAFDPEQLQEEEEEEPILEPAPREGEDLGGVDATGDVPDPFESREAQLFRQRIEQGDSTQPFVAAMSADSGADTEDIATIEPPGQGPSSRPTLTSGTVPNSAPAEENPADDVYDDDFDIPTREGPDPKLLGVIVLFAVVLLAMIGWAVLRNGGEAPAPTPMVEVTPTPAPTPAPTPEPTPVVADDAAEGGSAEADEAAEGGSAEASDGDAVALEGDGTPAEGDEMPAGETPGSKTPAPTPTPVQPIPTPAATPRPRPTPAATPRPTPTPAPATAEATQGKAMVISTPSGAAVGIDGKQRGNTPLSVELPTGSHEVKVSKSGYKDMTRFVNVTAGKNATVNVKLEEAATAAVTGMLNVVVAPPTPPVIVFVDGDRKGKAPLSVTVTAGAHQFRFEREGAEPKTESYTVDFSAGTTQTKVFMVQ